MRSRKRLVAIAIAILAAGIVNSDGILRLHLHQRGLAHVYEGGVYEGKEGVLMQTSYNDCGPASLQMIFERYGIVSSVDEIEQHVGMKAGGASMLSLKEAADRKGLHAEGWRLTMTDFMKASFPLMLFVNDDHFVVADSTCGQEVFLRDPAVGRIKMPLLELPRIWRGETLMIAKK